MRVAERDERPGEGARVDRPARICERAEARSDRTTRTRERDREARLVGAADALEWRVLGEPEQLLEVVRVRLALAEVVAERARDDLARQVRRELQPHVRALRALAA